MLAAIGRLVKRDGAPAPTPPASSRSRSRSIATSPAASARRSPYRDGRVQRLRIAERNSQIRFNDRRQSAPELLPRRPAIRRFEDASVSPSERAMGWATDPDRDKAAEAALANCRKNNGTLCQVQAAPCGSDDSRSSSPACIWKR